MYELAYVDLYERALPRGWLIDFISFLKKKNHDCNKFKNHII